MPTINLTCSDYSQLGSLQAYLIEEIPEVTVSRVSDAPARGELGVIDVLTVVFAGMSALSDMIGLIRDFLETRDSGTGITVSATSTTRRQTKSLELTDATQEDIREFLDWFKDE